MTEQSKLAYYRTLRGLSQQQLADKANVSVRTIQSYEIAQRTTANAQAHIIIKLADALGVHPKELI